MNTFREALKSGKRLLGTHVNLTDYRICEMMGYIGFDYLWIDMEHLATDFRTMESHLIAAKSAGTPSLVRVPWNDIPNMKRVLETGPDAIVVPMVNSYEEAKQAIDTCIYPPEGKRGCGPFRAIRYGIDDLHEYIDSKSKEMCRFLQVESVEAVEAMDAVCQIPYMDGFIIGPYDLSGSMGKLGHVFDSDVNAMIDLAIQKAHDNGKPIGISTGADTAEELEHWIKKGVDFISSGTDASCIIKGSKALLNRMSEISGKYRVANKEGE